MEYFGFWICVGLIVTSLIWAALLFDKWTVETREKETARKWEREDKRLEKIRAKEALKDYDT